MKCSILLLLISVGGCLSNDRSECFFEEMDRNCPIRNLSNRFPGTEEELKALCQNFIPLAECATSAREKCEFEKERTEGHRKTIAYLKEICDEDNPVFKALSSNLDCIAPAVHKLTDICPDKIISEENQKKLFKQQQLIMDEDVHPKCIYMVEDASCPAVTIGYFCENDELKEIALQVLGKIINNNLQCSDETVDKLIPIFDVYQTILLEELAQKYASENK